MTKLSFSESNGKAGFSAMRHQKYELMATVLTCHYAL